VLAWIVTHDPVAFMRAAATLAPKQAEEPEGPMADLDLSKLSDGELAIMRRCRSILDGAGDPGPDPAIAEMQTIIDHEREQHETAKRDLKFRDQEFAELRAKFKNREEQIAVLDKLVAGLDEKMASLETHQ
jgi:hypothetical protein